MYAVRATMKTKRSVNNYGIVIFVTTDKGQDPTNTATTSGSTAHWLFVASVESMGTSQHAALQGKPSLKIEEKGFKALRKRKS